MAGLSSDQIVFYKEQGYLIVEDALPSAVFDPLIGEFNETIERNARRAKAEGRLHQLFEYEPFARRLARLCETMDDESGMFDGLQGKLKTAGMFAMVKHPAILDIVESLIGPEILAHPQFNARAKLPNQDRSVVPWHQDLGYLEREAEETLMVNIWIPLVDATRENGCMEVIGGSHKSPLIEHHQRQGPGRNFKGILDEALPPGEQVLCPIKKGGVLLIQHKTIHRSIPNLSDHIRWSLDLRYSDPAMPTGRQNVPGFISRSRKQPEAVARSHLDWLEIVRTSR